MGTLYRSKKNDRLYKLYMNKGKMTGYTIDAEPFHHKEKLTGRIKVEDFDHVALD